jgi:hypothetical protein
MVDAVAWVNELASGKEPADESFTDLPKVNKATARGILAKLKDKLQQKEAALKGAPNV